MTRQFWMDQLVYVPRAIFLAVVMIFISPYVQRWRDKRAIARGQKKTKKVNDHYSRVIGYALDPHGLTQYLVLLGILAIGSGSTMTVGMVWLIVVTLAGTGSAAIPNNYLSLYWYGMGFFIWLIGVVPWFRLTSQAAELWLHVQSFDKYVASVPTEFRNLELEAKAREKLQSISGNTVPPQLPR